MVLLAHVRSAFALSNGTYGSPRMTRELQDEGFAIGRRRTARLMRENDLKARQKRRFKRTTDSQHAWPVAPNIIDQDFAAAGPDEKWGADISYVWTREGCDRPVRPPEGLIHHSDRGSQYCSIDYQSVLRRRGIRISMSGKGNCYDNAMVETFFKTLKSELVWRTTFHTRAEAEQAIARYIDGFYNATRRHSHNRYLSPVDFERRFLQLSPPHGRHDRRRRPARSPGSDRPAAPTRPCVRRRGAVMLSTRLPISKSGR
mgnify:CR=1 FL=1